MADSGELGQGRLRPLLFYGNNPVSLIGGALTSASAFTLVGFWVVQFFGHGGSNNPYLGILFDLILPGLFVLGLILIPIGMFFRRRSLKSTGKMPTTFPEISLRDPVFRRGIVFVVIATFINFVIVGTASYRGVAYMDTPSFCGTSCHVMAPEWNAYHVSAHAGVACTDCHIVSGVQGFVNAKVNGTKQLLMVVMNNYPRPIMQDDKVPSASATCLNCHNPGRYIGDKLVVSTAYGDDEKNAVTHSLTLVHVGGRDYSFSPERHPRRAYGAHGVHRHRLDPPDDSLGEQDQRRWLDDGVRIDRSEGAGERAEARDGLHRLSQSSGALLHYSGRSAQS